MIILSYLLPFFWPSFLINSSTTNGAARKQLDAGCPWKILESRQELEQVCVFSFICRFLAYFRSLISLSVKYSTALYISSFIPFIFTLFCLYLQRKDNLLSRLCNAISHSLVAAENARAPARPRHSQITTPDSKI